MVSGLQLEIFRLGSRGSNGVVVARRDPIGLHTDLTHPDAMSPSAAAARHSMH